MALAPSVAARPGHVYELEPALCRRLFGGTGRYARYGVIGDGSCFFHSVCVVLNYKGYVTAARERQAALAHEFRCRFQAKFDKHAFAYFAGGTTAHKGYAETKAGMCKPDVWADETIIKHAAHVLGLNIIFVDFDRAGKLYCNVHGAETLRATSPRRKGSGAANGAGAAAAAATAMTGGTGGKAKPTPRPTPRQATVVLAWINKAHFEPIVRIEAVQPTKTLVRALLEPSKRGTDAAAVQALMTTYVGQCGERVHDAHV